MGKKKPVIKIESYGRYSQWDRGSKDIPHILEFTEEIKAEEGNEFGMVLYIKGGKGIRLDYCIKHPPFTDKDGNVEPDFVGEYYVNSNDHKFYIGDCIWLPITDKTGKWVITVELEGSLVAQKSFLVTL